MSGDADVGTSTFTAKDSKIINNKGEIIFVTNTNTVITLENNTITNNDSDGAFLKATTAKWGTSGSNGGNVTLNMTNQKISGDMIIDNISTLALTMKNGSVLVGAINKENQAKNITLNISSDSVISLTADTYLDSLINEDSTNSNIYSNGKYRLYVEGKEISINSNTYDSSTTTEKNIDTKDTTTTANNNINNQSNIIYIIGGTVFLIIIGATSLIIVKKKSK